MTELKKGAAADKSEKDLGWPLFNASLLTSCFNPEEPTQFAGCRMIKFGLSIDEDDGAGWRW